MKRKYQGIVGMGIIVLLLLLVGGYYHSGLWRVTPTIAGPTQSPVSDGWIPSQEQVAHMNQLSGTLSRLAVPTTRDYDPSPLLIFGQRSKGGSVHDAHEQAEQEKRSYELSLTVSAGPIRYCIVDGAFVTEGAKLADGAIVKKIDNKRVLIAKERQMEWFYLQDPTQTKDRSEPFLFTQRKDKS
jgi:hypothetical protein